MISTAAHAAQRRASLAGPRLAPTAARRTAVRVCAYDPDDKNKVRVLRGGSRPRATAASPAHASPSAPSLGCAPPVAALAWIALGRPPLPLAMPVTGLISRASLAAACQAHLRAPTPQLARSHALTDGGVRNSYVCACTLVHLRACLSRARRPPPKLAPAFACPTRTRAPSASTCAPSAPSISHQLPHPAHGRQVRTLLLTKRRLPSAAAEMSLHPLHTHPICAGQWRQEGPERRLLGGCLSVGRGQSQAEPHLFDHTADCNWTYVRDQWLRGRGPYTHPPQQSQSRQ